MVAFAMVPYLTLLERQTNKKGRKSCKSRSYDARENSIERVEFRSITGHSLTDEVKRDC